MPSPSLNMSSYLIWPLERSHDMDPCGIKFPDFDKKYPRRGPGPGPRPGRGPSPATPSGRMGRRGWERRMWMTGRIDDGTKDKISRKSKTMSCGCPNQVEKTDTTCLRQVGKDFTLSLSHDMLRMLKRLMVRSQTGNTKHRTRPLEHKFLMMLESWE